MQGPDEKEVVGSYTFDTLPIKKTQTVSSVDSYSAQTLTYLLNPTLTVVSSKAPLSSDVSEKFLYVSLEDSSVIAGPMVEDTTDKKGYFTEKLEVLIELEDAVLRQSRPLTTAVGGSHTDSTDQSINVGIFGRDPNASLSISHNSSTSTSSQDYNIANYSDASVKLDYSLGLVDGASYNTPTDLVGSVFDQCNLHALPPRAATSLPLDAKAVFSCSDDLDKQRKLKITLKHTVTLVEKTMRSPTTAAVAIPLVGWFVAGVTVATQEGIVRSSHRNGQTIETTTAFVNVYTKQFEVVFELDINFNMV